MSDEAPAPISIDLQRVDLPDLRDWMRQMVARMRPLASAAVRFAGPRIAFDAKTSPLAKHRSNLGYAAAWWYRMEAAADGMVGRGDDCRAIAVAAGRLPGVLRRRGDELWICGRGSTARRLMTVRQVVVLTRRAEEELFAAAQPCGGVLDHWVIGAQKDAVGTVHVALGQLQSELSYVVLGIRRMRQLQREDPRLPDRVITDAASWLFVVSSIRWAKQRLAVARLVYPYVQDLREDTVPLDQRWSVRLGQELTEIEMALGGDSIDPRAESAVLGLTARSLFDYKTDKDERLQESRVRLGALVRVLADRLRASPQRSGAEHPKMKPAWWYPKVVEYKKPHAVPFLAAELRRAKAAGRFVEGETCTAGRAGKPGLFHLDRVCEVFSYHAAVWQQAHAEGFMPKQRERSAAAKKLPAKTP